MSKILSILCVMVFILGLCMQTADAGRFGGGRSFGMQRSANYFSRSGAPSAAVNSARPSRVGSALTGLAMGGLLAYLFMGHGMGAGLLTWLALGMGLLLLVRLFTYKQSVAAAHSGQFSTFQAQQQGFAYNAATLSAVDQTQFLRGAKVLFNRLQADYDTKNLMDIQQFCTPEVYADIQLDIQERGNRDNVTEVISLNAEFMDSTQDREGELYSVLFNGVIREAVNQDAQPFREVWHFRKNTVSNKWVVAGIQQQA